MKTQTASQQLSKTAWVQLFFKPRNEAMGSMKAQLFPHLLFSPWHWFRCCYSFIYLFLCRVTMQMLCNGNQFSFVLDRDVVVIFIHKNLMHVFSYPASFLAIGSGESRETAWALSTGGRYVVEGKYRNTREAVRVSTCIIIKAHPVFICTAVACHLQLLLHC